MKYATAGFAGVLLVCVAFLPVQAKTSWKDELIAKINETYKPTDRSFLNLENVKGGGTVMVLTQGGATATLSTDASLWTTGIRDGKLSTGDATSRSTSRFFKKGEKVFILDVKILEDVKIPDKSHADIIRLMVLSTEAVPRQEEGSTVERRYKGGLDFQFPLNYLQTAAFADVKKALNTTIVAASEFAAADTPTTVRLGMTPEEVEGSLGKPQKVIDLGIKKIYVYADIKVTFEEGKVSDVQ